MNRERGFHQEVIEASHRISNFDVSNDTLKYTIDNTPLNKGGANFKTNKLVKLSTSKYTYRPTIGMVIFCSLFTVVGLGIIIFYLNALFKSSSNSLVALIVGLVFFIAGSLVSYYSFMPRVFDKSLGLYYKSYKTNAFREINKNPKNSITHKEIAAIQLIGEHVKGRDNSYKSFELNLVLKDGTRRNVIDHGILRSVVNDAEVLSKFLNIPIWHATSHLE